MFQRVLLDFVLKTFGLGAENETRTRDPNLGKVVLYQLSYFRISVCVSRCQALPLPRLEYIILLGQSCALPTELFPHFTFSITAELLNECITYFGFASANIRHFFLSCKQFTKKNYNYLYV